MTSLHANTFEYLSILSDTMIVFRGEKLVISKKILQYGDRSQKVKAKTTFFEINLPTPNIPDRFAY